MVLALGVPTPPSPPPRHWDKTRCWGVRLRIPCQRRRMAYIAFLPLILLLVALGHYQLATGDFTKESTGRDGSLVRTSAGKHSKVFA